MDFLTCLTCQAPFTTLGSRLRNGVRYCPMPSSNRHPKFCSLRCCNKQQQVNYRQSLLADPSKKEKDLELRRKSAEAPHRVAARLEYTAANRDKQRVRNERFRADPVKAERARHRNMMRSRQERKERSRQHVEWVKKKRREDPAFKTVRNLRSRLYCAVVRAQAGQKTASAAELIGCTPQALVAYLEALFQPGMSWDNYALDGWHIDHIRPCASFDLTDPAQQRECFHHTNLQPLWAKDNREKWDCWEPATMAA